MSQRQLQGTEPVILSRHVTKTWLTLAVGELEPLNSWLPLGLKICRTFSSALVALDQAPKL